MEIRWTDRVQMDKYYIESRNKETSCLEQNEERVSFYISLRN